MKQKCRRQQGLSIYILFSLIALALPAHAMEIGSKEETSYQWSDTVMQAPLIINLPLHKVQTYGNGTCVPYARERSGILLYGNANTFLDQAVDSDYHITDKPEIGAIVVLAEGTMGHVAVVEELTEQGFVVSEQNYEGLYVVSRREVLSGYEKIKGFIVR